MVSHKSYANLWAIIPTAKSSFRALRQLGAGLVNRLQLTDAQRITLADIAHRLTRKAFEGVAIPLPVFDVTAVSPSSLISGRVSSGCQLVAIDMQHHLVALVVGSSFAALIGACQPVFCQVTQTVSQ